MSAAGLFLYSKTKNKLKLLVLKHFHKTKFARKSGKLKRNYSLLLKKTN